MTFPDIESAESLQKNENLSSNEEKKPVPHNVSNNENSLVDTKITTSLLQTSIPIVDISRKPSYFEIFLGQGVERLNSLQTVRSMAEALIRELCAQKNKEAIEPIVIEVNRVKAIFDIALQTYQITPGMIWAYQWSLLVLLIITGLAEVLFIDLYCRWHGSYFISLNLYNPVNINLLSQINFVNGPTTMSVAAEVLMWSSLGVWAQQSFQNTEAMVRRKFRFVDDGLSYIGNMMRATSIAAIIVIILRLTKFSIFDVSLDVTSPLAFDATIGLSFLLGFFGTDAYRVLLKIKSNFLDRAVPDSDNVTR